MMRDLLSVRDSLCSECSTTKWVETLQGIGPHTRKVVEQFMKLDVALPRAISQVLGLGPLMQFQDAENDDDTLAIGCVLVHAALEIFTSILHTSVDRARCSYEDYFREDYCSATPSTLIEAIVQAVDRGEEALRDLVIREAASRRSLAIPTDSLTQKVHHFIDQFELIGYEASRITLGRKCPGLFLTSLNFVTSGRFQQESTDTVHLCATHE